jgi:hypothetical protein
MSCAELQGLSSVSRDHVDPHGADGQEETLSPATSDAPWEAGCCRAIARGWNECVEHLWGAQCSEECVARGLEIAAVDSTIFVVEDLLRHHKSL